MKFDGLKDRQARLEREYLDAIHPDLRKLLSDLDRWTEGRGYPPLTLTSLVRTEFEQEAIYAPRWLECVRRYEKGEKLTRVEKAHAMKCWGKSEAEVRNMARARFSWHLARCAADIRIYNYLPEQLLAVKGWLQDKAREPLWFWLHELTPPHIHVERRAFDWRKEYDRGRNLIA